MNSSSASLHGTRPPLETDRGQKVTDVDAAQQLKLRDRQRFFEEVFQHDVDVYLSSAHLCIRDYKRPPLSSISSMEVNVDMLEQMELFDIPDQETLDVFFSSGGDESVLSSPLPGLDAKSRLSSTSNSSSDSQTTNASRGDTLSDDEETHSSTDLERCPPSQTDKN